MGRFFRPTAKQTLPISSTFVPSLPRSERCSFSSQTLSSNHLAPRPNETRFPTNIKVLIQLKDNGRGYGTKLKKWTWNDQTFRPLILFAFKLDLRSLVIFGRRSLLLNINSLEFERYSFRARIRYIERRSPITLTLTLVQSELVLIRRNAETTPPEGVGEWRRISAKDFLLDVEPWPTNVNVFVDRQDIDKISAPWLTLRDETLLSHTLLSPTMSKWTIQEFSRMFLCSIFFYFPFKLISYNSGSLNHVVG